MVDAVRAKLTSGATPQLAKTSSLPFAPCVSKIFSTGVDLNQLEGGVHNDSIYTIELQ